MKHALRSVAVAQTTPIRADVERNIAQHVRLARAAAEQRAEILVFPEFSLTGYELDLASELAFSSNDPRLAPLVETAVACSMALVVGAPIRAASRLHIGALVLRPDRAVDVYTKHHLGAFPPDAAPDGVVPPAEASVFDPGNSNPLIRLGAGTAAVAVCADVGHASHARRAAERGVDTYLASMFVIPPDIEKEHATLAACARRHSMTVAMANFGGGSGGLPSAGRSAIWAASTGKLLARLEPSGAGVAIAREERNGRWTTGAFTLAGDS